MKRSQLQANRQNFKLPNCFDSRFAVIFRVADLPVVGHKFRISKFKLKCGLTN